MHPQGPKLAGERFVQSAANLGAHIAIVTLIVAVPIGLLWLVAFVVRLGWEAAG